ncbi:MAG: CHRD domain-containing protein [Nitrosopumilus sp.]|nr:CHRD domain-containing protein [Nitrosopumilus sp.]
MKTKTNALVFSLVAIFAISTVMGITLQDADAADNKWKFKKEPSFTATLNTVPSTPAGFDGTATAKFWLDKNGESLKYRISIENMDISGGATSETSDDVTKLHLHENHHGAHVLNVYKAPGEDDADLVVKPTKGFIKGIWDDGDENQSYGGHDNSETLTSQLKNLCDGNLFTMIHGDGGVGVLRGDILPTSDGEKICEKLDKKGLLDSGMEEEHES